MEGMLNYYKANYPRNAAEAAMRSDPSKAKEAVPAVKCPVLLIHGLKDQALLPGAQRHLELGRE